MFCKKCGSELRPGAKFCGICGAPAQAQEANAGQDINEDVEQSQGNLQTQAGQARHRSRRRMPMALIVVIVILALATLASAAYPIYTQVFNPNPPAQEQVVEDVSGDEEDAEAETEDATEEQSEEAPAETEEAPAEEAAPEEEAAPAEPVSTHDYENEYFSIDAPDNIAFTGSSSGGAYTWWISGPVDDGNGNLVWQGGMTQEVTEYYSNGGGFTITIGPNVTSDPYMDYGTTSGGLHVQVSTAGGSSIYNNYYGEPSNPEQLLHLTVK